MPRKRKRNCDKCGKYYEGAGKYFCSAKCAGRGHEKGTNGNLPESEKQITERFWSKVEIKGKDECWEWKEGLVAGYGCFTIRGKTVLAHRFSFEFASPESFDDNLHVLHICDNPICVNPAHLFAGTHQDNMTDKSLKGRGKWDDVTRKSFFNNERFHTTKLTPDEVRSIRTDREQNGYTYDKLAEMYSVSKSNIQHIIKGNTWKHIS